MSAFEYDCALYQHIAPAGDAFGESAIDPPPKCGYLTLSLGITSSPVLAAFVEGVDRKLGSQIAVKMSLESLLEEGLAVVNAHASSGSVCSGLEIVRAVFRKANHDVYHYGHKMAAGGQIAARGLVAVYDGVKVSIGQVGVFGSFLWRDGQLVQFHEQASGKEPSDGILQRFIGANAKILVDLATTSVRDGDVVIVTSLSPSGYLLSVVEELLQDMDSLDETCRQIAKEGVCFRGAEADQAAGREAKNVMVFLIRIGPPTIELQNVVLEETDETF